MTPKLPLRHVAVLAALAVAGCECGDEGLTAVAPVIVASPSPLDFGVAYVGIGATQTLEVKNVGGATLEVSGLRLAEGTHPAVSLTSEAFSLVPGASQSVRVQFVPTEVGPAHGAVLIDSDDPVTPVLEVPIAGAGERRIGPVISVCVEGEAVGPAQCVDPLRVDFGEVPFGQTRTATILVRSIGTLPLEIVSAAAEAGAHPSIGIEPPTYAGTMAVGDRLQVTLTFSPSVPEPVSAVYQINSNDAERSFVPVIITGSGTAPTLCLSEAALDFGQVQVGSFAERTLQIESCGSVAFDLSELAVATNPEFSIVMPPATPLNLPPGQTLDVTLRYSPVDPGRDQDQLIIRSTLPDGFVALTGEAIACDLVVLPARVNFNPVASGRSATRSVLVENSGGIDCQITAVRLGAGSSSDFTASRVPALPATIPAGQSATIEVTYTPSDAGSDAGTLEIEGSDPAEPVMTVDLSGRRLAFGECALVITPDPIAFGAVAVGTPRTLQVDLQNSGTSLCTVSQIRLTPSTSRDFRLGTALGAPMLIPGGQSRQIDVIFTPRTAQLQTGEMEVFTGLIPISPDFLVPITGAGSGPMLCPMPTPVVFGTHAPGLPVPRQLQLVSCGTQDVVVSSLTLPLPTSSEFSMPAPLTTPLTIAAGTQVNLPLSYTGANDGRDDGTLRIQSNDASAATQDVHLIAHTSNLACGDIQGRLCDLTGTGPVVGGTVYVDTPTGRIQTTTDANGDWVLTCVPAGNWLVHAEYGSWSTTLQATVTPGAITTFPGQQCLEPDSAEVAVVYGEWDQMENILDGLNVPYTFYGQGQASQLVNNANTLAQYDIVFFNCGWEEQLGISGTGRANIANFVMNGGTVYASDWAYDLVEVSWPAFVDFYGDDAVIDAAQSAGGFNGPVFVRDASLAAALQGRTQVTIDSCCTAIDAAGMGTTVYLEGDRLRNGSQVPLMVSFQPTMNSGRVWYTDFHNSGQLDINDIFSWLILQL